MFIYLQSYLYFSIGQKFLEYVVMYLPALSVIGKRQNPIN